MATTLQPPEVTGAALHETLHEDERPSMAPSDNFYNKTVSNFTVTEWPLLGGLFKLEGRKGSKKLIPYTKYAASFSTLQVEWKIEIEINEDPAEGLRYWVQGTYDEVTVSKEDTTAAGALKKIFGVDGLDLPNNPSTISAPNFFCLTGQNKEKKNITIQGIFQKVKVGPRRRSSKPAADSNDAVRHAVDSCKTFLDALPTTERQEEAIESLVKKYLSKKNFIPSLKVNESIKKFLSLAPTKKNVEVYRVAVDHILTTILMDERTDPDEVRHALGIPNDKGKERVSRALKRADAINATSDPLDNNYDPTKHLFTEPRELRHTSFAATGLDKEVKQAWYDPDCAEATYTGKDKPTVYVLSCHKQHVRVVFVQKKRLLDPTFDISWTKFNEYRPKNVKDNSARSCLCPYHLRFYFFIDALFKYRRDIHKVGSVGYASGGAGVVSCECEDGDECECIVKANHNARDVLYGSLCPCRGLPADFDEDGANDAALKRVKNLSQKNCYTMECQKCSPDGTMDEAKEKRTKKNKMCQEEHDVGRAKIERSIGSCIEEDENAKFSLEVTLQASDTVTIGKTLKGKEKVAYKPTVVSILQFWMLFTAFLPEFYLHAYVASYQSRQLNGTGGIVYEAGHRYAILNIDYSENWTHLVHDEVQNQYFCRTNSTLVPVVITIDTCDVKPSLWKKMKINKEEFEKERSANMLPHKIQVALAFISEDKTHDKAMSQRIMTDCINYIQKYTTCTSIITISDGCRAQFKSRHMFGWMASVAKKYGMGFQWHFHCSCHGKSICDAMGGHWKALAEHAVEFDNAHISTAKLFFDFLQDRKKQGLTSWNDVKKKKVPQDEKGEKYGLRIQYEEYFWIPRAGLPGMVVRSDIIDYEKPKKSNGNWSDGNSKWHRAISLSDGTLAISALSCFCTECRNHDWASCLFQTDTGGVESKTPAVDTEKTIAMDVWTEAKSLVAVTTLNKNNWVVFHLTGDLEKQRDMFWDNSWGIGKFVEGEQGKTDLTAEGTMMCIAPYRTSQIDGVFLEQESNVKLLVSSGEIVVCGLECEVSGRPSKYTDKYYANSDKKKEML